MSDSTVQEFTVPLEDQPSEDGSVVNPNPAPPVETVVTSHDTDVAVDQNGVAPATAAAPVAPAPRAKASNLEGDLRAVLDDYVSGVLKLADGSLPTPHTLAAEIAKRRGDGGKVSSGAVSAALIRWQEIGFATLTMKPMAFVDYTDAARSQGLSALKTTHRANKSAARKAAAEPTPTIAPAEAAPPAGSAVSTAPVSDPSPAPEQTPAPSDAAQSNSGDVPF